MNEARLKAKSVKQIKEWMCRECRQSAEYKSLTKRGFRQHAGYINYKQFAVEVASQLVTIPEAVQVGKPSDPTWSASTHAFWCAMNSPSFPVYAITKELLQAFVYSDPPQQLWGIPKIFERALFMLPQGMVKNPDGLSLNWVLVDFLEPWSDLRSDDKYAKYVNTRCRANVKEKLKPYLGIESSRIRWAASLELEYIYSSTTRIPEPNSTHSINYDYNSFGGWNVRAEEAFSKLVTSLVFQAVLYMARAKPGAITEEATSQGVGFRSKHQRREDPNVLRDFIWVGKNFQLRKPHQGGSHQSPVGHPRRGHYRNLPWRDTNREVWVRPTWVGAE